MATDNNTLKANLRGDLIQPGDAGYNEARKLYNAMIDKKPRLIARCVDVADVIACVNHARENGILLAVRARVNAKLATFEQVRKFHVLDRDFSIELGELTATLKVRRTRAIENFREKVAECYPAGHEQER